MINDKSDIDNILSSSISAGFGALTFRNHYRSLKEQTQSSKWKKAGKIGAGLGAAGLVGVAGLTALRSGDDTEDFDKVKGATGKVVNKVKDRFSDDDASVNNLNNINKTNNLNKLNRIQ